jgi:radical SAM superfamily enzyme YgiQ (UPF0313 family)
MLALLLRSQRKSMNALLIYPQFPDTFWSFKHVLKFIGKRAAQPPLGLITVAALLPKSWKLRLVDTNVERLLERDLKWADVVLLSAMLSQQDSLVEIVERCRAHGLKTVIGGPIASSLTQDELKVDHVVIGEAEALISGLARDLEQGTAKPLYQAAERPEMTSSPMPDLSLIKLKRYSTMTVQYSRGCPFNCEFCDIIEIYGRKPRTKAIQQVLAELNQMIAAGWRDSVFVVDDNFIGNKVRAKELLHALVEWRRETGFRYDFITEASLNLADDPELMQLMKDAGFRLIFMGIETPDEQGLISVNKLQNTRRSLLESVATIQSYGMQVMGGFILGFDTDREDIFDRMVEFIQKSAIPIAMVGLLQAVPGTQLFKRLRGEGRIVDSGGGNNTSGQMNFLPHMDATRLVEGYHSVLKRIYNCEAYYERAKVYLSRVYPGTKNTGERGAAKQTSTGVPYQHWITRDNMRALALSVVRQGVFGKHRWSYWKFVAAAATRYRRCFGAAMTLAVMGYHFEVMTRKLSKTMEVSALPSAAKALPEQACGE